MPVHGNHFDRRAARHFSRGSELHIKQRQNSAEQVRNVRAGLYVKNTAAGIRRQENSLRGELAPGQNVSGDEKNPEKRSSGPPVTKTFVVLRAEAAVCARQREAAGYQ